MGFKESMKTIVNQTGEKGFDKINISKPIEYSVLGAGFMYCYDEQGKLVSANGMKNVFNGLNRMDIVRLP